MGLSNLADRLTRISPSKTATVIARAADQSRRQRDHAAAVAAAAPAAGAAPAAAAAPAAGAAPAANDTPAAPAAPGGIGHAIMSSAPMQAIGRAFNFMTSVEQALTAPLGAIPFPSLPAVTIGSNGMGIPHAHSHPPNLVPPAPPLPFPHLTQLISIPILSGAENTKIGGKPAARCGDMGLSAFCGGFFPLCEVFLGSATVWIEGARAGRVGVDITKHCIFTSPKPSDPPLGPMVGATLAGDATVMIGGVPLPSLTSMAMGAAFKALFKGVGVVGRAVGKTRPGRALRMAVLARRGRKYVAKLLDDWTIRLHGDDAFNRAAIRDLEIIAGSPAGRAMFDDIARTGHHVDMHPPSMHAVLDAELYRLYGERMPTPGFSGPYQLPHLPDYAHAQAVGTPNPNGPLVRSRDGVPVSVASNKGASSHIVYDPTGRNPAHGATAGTPSAVIAGHELNHARRAALGDRANDYVSHDPNWNAAWHNVEEYHTVQFENEVRRSIGLPERPDYTSPLP